MNKHHNSNLRVEVAEVVMDEPIPGFREISQWLVEPVLPMRIKDFGICRDPDPHCTMYLVLVDSRGRAFNLFFDRFLGRLCFGEDHDDEHAAFLKKQSQIQIEAFAIIEALCNGNDATRAILARLEIARNYI